MTSLAPRELTSDGVTRHVATIWQDVLGAPQDPSDATFFELQGQSIAAVRIITRIEDELGVDVDVAILFDDPDLATFAREVLTQAGLTGDAGR